jgi:hypothetical protein
MCLSVYYWDQSWFRRPNPAGILQLTDRLAYYKEHADSFDLVFVGDSKTYCDIHPHVVDPILGTRSINLGSSTHWFPTQYPFIQDLVESIPSHATVVWSVGHQNFFRSGDRIYHTYPIGLANVPRYLFWGYSLGDLAYNLSYFNPLAHLYVVRGQLRSTLVAKTESTFVKLRRQPEPAPAAASPQPWRAMELPFKSEPWVARVEMLAEDGRVTSVVLYGRHGGYLRLELNPSFFRAKQRELRAGRYGKKTGEDLQQAEALPTLAPELWNTFQGILHLFREKQVHLIVNELEEAPFTYFDREHREWYRDFMRTTVKPYVEQLGFTYVAVDFDRIQDDDYFDYNHMNSQGIVKFTPMLAQTLRPHLPMTSH